jgi:DNA-binding NarL/FixJ family response regulator
VAVDAPGNDDLFRPRAASFALLVISQRQALSAAAVLPRSGAADLAACGILEAVNGRFPTTWVRASTDRPTVLLVDDHRGVLDTVSEILADDFEVAALATDGREALDAARRLEPDLIVLDINMPGLDGFQTFRALEQAGSRAPVVFLSMFDGVEHVAEAFRCGGHGYVVKSRAARDLPTALEQALHGRLFAPSLMSLSALTDGAAHVVQLHSDTGRVVDELADVFDAALRRGDAVCLITGEDLRERLAVRLRGRGWPVDGATAHKRYLTLDAGDALNRCMRDGLPDAGVLQQIAAELEEYRRAAAQAPTSRLTIFGNPSASLVADGNIRAAIALEHLWHRLTATLPFLTICGYPASCFGTAAHDGWVHACAEHHAVSHASDI